MVPEVNYLVILGHCALNIVPQSTAVYLNITISKYYQYLKTILSVNRSSISFNVYTCIKIQLATLVFQN